MTNLKAARLEHLNVTVKDANATAELLCDLFGWHVRWSGDSIHDGWSAHVGEGDTYLALYNGPDGGPLDEAPNHFKQRAGLNHIGIVVSDLDAVERRVKTHGYTPNSHADYEPGRRFYFTEENGLEIEVVQYD